MKALPSIPPMFWIIWGCVMVLMVLIVIIAIPILKKESAAAERDYARWAKRQKNKK